MVLQPQKPLIAVMYTNQTRTNDMNGAVFFSKYPNLCLAGINNES